MKPDECWYRFTCITSEGWLQHDTAFRCELRIGESVELNGQFFRITNITRPDFRSSGRGRHVAEVSNISGISSKILKNKGWEAI